MTFYLFLKHILDKPNMCFSFKKKDHCSQGSDLSISSFYARVSYIDGGGRGIRTPARFNPPVGFQDRSLQPDLGIPPYNKR